MSDEYLSAEQTATIINLALDVARTGEIEELIGFLDHGVPVDVADTQSNTLLMLAAYHGHAEAVQVLLSRGADPNICNTRGQSPIAGAIFKGEDDIVRALRLAGADLDIGTPTARDAATLFGRQHLLDQ